MRPSNSILTSVLILLLLASRGLLAGTSAPTMPASSGFPLTELGQRADQQKAPPPPVLDHGQALLEAPLQALRGRIGPDGLRVESTSPTEGRGVFSLIPTRVDTGGQVTALPPGTVTTRAQTVVLDRGLVEEAFTASGDGLRQDFIVKQRPVGPGPLTLTLAVQGATARQKGGNIALTLPGQRELLYHGLKVTDAEGREFKAQLTRRDEHTLVIAVNEATARYPLTLDPTISDADWQSVSGGWNGANSTVLALAYDRNKNCLYVGGVFTSIGNTLAKGVAAWDGSNWSALGSGIEMHGVERVEALAVASNGALYAGGLFKTAGGVPAENIASWDGTAWRALGAGVGLVHTLVVAPDDSLFAGGDFAKAGINNIARWNGNTWSPLPGELNGGVWALAVTPEGRLYAGGVFTKIGGLSTNYIALWDGSAWSPLGSGLDLYANALALAPDGRLYVGGFFTKAGGLSANYIALWDGSAWSPLGGGVSKYVKALAVATDGSLYASGAFQQAGGNAVRYIAKWNGSSWSELGSGFDDPPSTLLASPDGSLFAGGEFNKAGDNAASGLAQWDGSAWSPLYPGISRAGYVKALTVAPGDVLYAGGYFSGIGGVAANNIAQWDGSAWSALGAGIDGVVDVLMASGEGSLYAGGSFSKAGEVTVNDIAKWNGNEWLALGNGIDNIPEAPRTYYVSSLAMANDGSLYVGGNFESVSGIAVNDIAKWDGSVWSALGNGIDNSLRENAVTALAMARNGALYVGGTFTTNDGNPGDHIAKWYGGVWAALGAGLNGPPSDLAVAPDGSVYAGGEFTSAGGIGAYFIAKWAGSTWSPLGAGMNATVTSLAVADDGSLYAGGSFTMAGGIEANRIAKWDGVAWSALGSGIQPGFSSALALGCHQLYVGGNFLTAGGKFTPSLASVNLATTPVTASITAANKPYDGSVSAKTICKLAGVARGDEVACAATTASFDSAEVGVGKTVTATDIVLRGAAACSYRLNNTTATARASIGKARPATRLEASATSTTYREPITFTATVTGVAKGALVTGQVAFKDGDKLLATRALASGIASHTLNTLGARSHTIAAVYSGDANNTVSKGGPLTVTIAKAEQAPLELTVKSTQLIGGEKTTLKATGGTGAGAIRYAATPEGEVTCAITTNVLTARGGPGRCVITATKLGNVNYLPVTSSTVEVNVKAFTPVSVGLTAAPAAPVYGQPVSFTATVTGNDPTGFVAFLEGETQRAKVPLTEGTAVYVSDTLPVGAHTLVAKYLGDTNDAATASEPRTVTIAQAQQALLVLTVTPTQLISGGKATLETTGGTVAGAITYAAIGTGGVTCQVAANALTAQGGPGQCLVTATKAGNTNYLPVTSDTVVVDVAFTPVSVGLTAAPAAPVYGQPVSFTATVTGNDPTGFVAFLEGETQRAKVPLAGGRAVYSSQTLPAGEHILVAKYLGDPNDAATNSEPVTVTIAQAEQTPLVLTATPDHLVSGDDGARLAVSGGSGNGALNWDVTPSGASVCRITFGRILKATGSVGACEVTVTKAGSDNYRPASTLLRVPVSDANIAIGKTYQGGIIFYIDDTGAHGLIAAPQDQSAGIQWGNGSFTATGATGTAVGTGQANTDKIIAAQGAGNYAATLAANLVLNGYNDWFLPSKDELNLMYKNIGPGAPAPLTNIGGFSSAWYWSSSENYNFTAWIQSFGDGYQGDNYKNATNTVRAVRAF